VVGAGIVGATARERASLRAAPAEAGGAAGGGEESGRSRSRGDRGGGAVGGGTWTRAGGAVGSMCTMLSSPTSWNGTGRGSGVSSDELDRVVLGGGVLFGDGVTTCAMRRGPVLGRLRSAVDGAGVVLCSVRTGVSSRTEMS
jgi:hypothetical protein